MNTYVLDTGALIALDRGDRDLLSTLYDGWQRGNEVRVPTGVVAQAWRDPARQAILSRALKRCDEIPSTAPRRDRQDSYAAGPAPPM